MQKYSGADADTDFTEHGTEFNFEIWLKNEFRETHDVPKIFRPEPVSDLHMSEEGEIKFKGRAHGYLVMASDREIDWAPTDGDAHFAPEHEIVPGVTLLFITDATSFVLNLTNGANHLKIVPFQGGGGQVLYGEFAQIPVVF